jgi:hypothetical protein
MPTPRVLMSKIRQALQLLADAGLSMRQVAAALGVSKTTVSEIAMYARDAGVDWPLASTLSDDELQARLYPPPRPRSTTRGARLRRAAPGTQATGRHAAVAVGGVPRWRRPAGLPLQRVLREVPRLGQAPEALDAPGPPRRRAPVRRLRRPDRAGGRPGQRRDPPRPGVRGRAGRVELHLRLRHLAADGRRLGGARSSTRWSSSAACPGCWCPTSPAR